MAAITLDQLLTAREKKPLKVPTPEIEPGGFCYVAGLGADDRDLMEMQWKAFAEASETERVGFRKFVVAWCLCDENNIRTLEPGTNEGYMQPAFIKQMITLGETIPLPALARLFDAAFKQMGYSAEDVEELEKN